MTDHPQSSYRQQKGIVEKAAADMAERADAAARGALGGFIDEISAVTHPQTATERFVRAAVDGGYRAKFIFFESADWRDTLDYDIRCEIHDYGANNMLMDPALWEAAGRSLGWSEEKTSAYYDQECDYEWQYRWQCLLHWLAAHPGDVEGYLASLLDDDPLPHQEPCNCRDCSLTDAKGTE